MSKVKRRNWHAVNAHFRKSGAYTDQKKEASRLACRRIGIMKRPHPYDIAACKAFHRHMITVSFDGHCGYCGEKE